jgi:polyphosphate kinase 2 (PPK2 family)
MALRDDLDMTLKLSREDEVVRLAAGQRRLLALRLQCAGLIGDGTLGPPICLLFEGWDAGGKGGAIRRVTSPLDPRHVTVSSFSAPTAREKRHHFLWRFSDSLPGWGGMTVLDRSWYGRVLVERVEGFATKTEWQRAYAQIVEFERGLCAEGMVLMKFWLEISDAEQLRRFTARANDPLKQWKLTDEDWRNRARRPDYEKALEMMLKRTDHAPAPWHVIPAENKRYARVAVIETVISEIERGLRAVGQEPVTLEAEL